MKYGKLSGLQRYRCNECRRTFNALTGTSMSRLRKKELWLEYSQALADSLSLTKAAAKCGVDRTTAFRWRHRFLQGSGKASQPCTGITEIDETYFRESYKGKKLTHRKPRKRGKLSVRGLSDEQATVIIAKKEVDTCMMPYIDDSVYSRLESAKFSSKQVIHEVALSSGPHEESESSGDTTNDEMCAFFIIQSILRETINPRRVVIRDAKSYCAVLLDNNNRKPLCRMFLDVKKPSIILFDGESEERVYIEVLKDIYQYADRLKNAVKKYDKK